MEPPTSAAAAVAPGVRALRMTLPYALDHVNLWLLDDGDGLTLVDTGHDDAETRAGWERLEATVLGGRPVRRIVATHYHPDHLGLAGWLCERWGAELWCTRAEWLSGRVGCLEGVAEAAASAQRFYAAAGVPAAALGPVVRRARSYRDSVSPVPPSYRRLKDGDALSAGGATWSVLAAGGHSPEHACLWARERGLFISGDQVLPHITPNVSVWPGEPEEDPLLDFLAALPRLREVPDEVLVLPSHGPPFRGLRRRCDELAAHHEERLAAVRAACDRPRTAYEVMRILFERDLDPHQTTFAIGEAIAHLHRLMATGSVGRERPARGPDRYVRAGAAP